MNPEVIDELLANMDACLNEMSPVTCWKCMSAPGEPSVCRTCKETSARYESPPKGTVREAWIG